jgi:hypothetical protein
MMGIHHPPTFLMLDQDMHWHCDDMPVLARIAESITATAHYTPDKGNPYVWTINLVANMLGGTPEYPAGKMGHGVREEDGVS